LQHINAVFDDLGLKNEYVHTSYIKNKLFAKMAKSYLNLTIYDQFFHNLFPLIAFLSLYKCPLSQIKIYLKVLKSTILDEFNDDLQITNAQSHLSLCHSFDILNR